MVQQFEEGVEGDKKEGEIASERAKRYAYFELLSFSQHTNDTYAPTTTMW